MSSFVDRIFIPQRDHDPLGVHGTSWIMSESNGVDLGQIAAMLRSMIVGQEQLRVELTGEIVAVRRELKSDIAALERRFDDLRHEVSSLRQAVESYHHTVIGHGIFISELDARTSRIENHLDLPPFLTTTDRPAPIDHLLAHSYKPRSEPGPRIAEEALFPRGDRL